jgi:hypothetical protein
MPMDGRVHLIGIQLGRELFANFPQEFQAAVALLEQIGPFTLTGRIGAQTLGLQSHLQAQGLPLRAL